MKDMTPKNKNEGVGENEGGGQTLEFGIDLSMDFKQILSLICYDYQTEQIDLSTDLKNMYHQLDGEDYGRD